ncbi:MAG: sigma-70 domain-containing protein [Lachnospiraceae bacterium]|nr:sigma-70 domain-containing protein [Lachnospiraceae bacterium]
MDKERAFAIELQNLITVARSQGNVVTEDQVKEYFRDMDLTEQQLAMVHEYLRENKIGIDQAVNLDDYLTDDDVHYLDMYLEELKELATWTEEHKKEVMLAAMKGSEEARMQLVEAYLPQVVEVARLYAGQGVLLEDLIGEGNVAITLGMKMLELAEDVAEAEGMIGKMIMDAMEKHISDNMDATDAEKKVLEKINQIAELSRTLAEDLGRKVTVEELVRESQYTEDEILEAIEVTAKHMDDIEVANE